MSKDKNLKWRAIIRIAMFPLFLGLLVFLPAGTFRFWQVYLYFFVLIIPLIAAMIYLYRTAPELLERRMRTKEKEKMQKVFVALSSISIVGAFVVPGLDYRFGWSAVPFSFVIAADVLVFLSYLFIFYVFKVNSYASRVIEVAEDQKVISSGPYAMVRHPMYSGMLIMYLATPVALASYWGILPAALLPFLLVLRIGNEEKVLRENLDGYSEYCEKVKYRMIPFIW